MEGNPIGRVSPKKFRGLGDVVAAVAQPIAGMVDSVAGTHLKGCAGCRKRQVALNRMVPFNLENRQSD